MLRQLASTTQIVDFLHDDMNINNCEPIECLCCFFVLFWFLFMPCDLLPFSDLHNSLSLCYVLYIYKYIQICKSFISNIWVLFKSSQYLSKCPNFFLLKSTVIHTTLQYSKLFMNYKKMYISDTSDKNMF